MAGSIITNNPHAERLDQELARFREVANLGGGARKALNQYFEVDEPHPYILTLKRKSTNEVTDKSHSSIDLCFIGILHGNEVLGSAVINNLIDYVRANAASIDLNLAFILGNTEASLQNTRFIEYDLNRSFGQPETTKKEWQRADQIESILDQTRFLVDFHQTREDSVSPFFIFPFEKQSFNFACSLSQELPIVTHWGESFSSLGECSDEYLIRRGGIGITLELGQNGFSNPREKIGTAIGTQAINNVSKWKVDSILSKKELEAVVSPKQQIYTWLKTFEWPASHKARILQKWENFSEIGPDVDFCEVDDIIYKTDQTCRVLFPYYPKPNDKKAQNELGRLIREVSVDELRAVIQ